SARLPLKLALGLAVVVIGLFARTLNHGFISLDDYDYVTQNPHVSSGLSAENIGWAFGHAHSSNWHPITWVSHMIDCALFGLNPTGPHAVNVRPHAVTAALLLLVLHRMTGSLWPSAFAAALFALHPLRAESVAWVAERKDVLSGLFFVLALGAYDRYVRLPSV